jgi:hypothetical protein
MLLDVNFKKEKSMIGYMILGLSIGLVIGALVALGVAAVVLMDTIQLYEAKIKDLFIKDIKIHIES